MTSICWIPTTWLCWLCTYFWKTRCFSSHCAVISNAPASGSPTTQQIQILFSLPPTCLWTVTVSDAGLQWHDTCLQFTRNQFHVPAPKLRNISNSTKRKELMEFCDSCHNRKCEVPLEWCHNIYKDFKITKAVCSRKRQLLSKFLDLVAFPWRLIFLCVWTTYLLLIFLKDEDDISSFTDQLQCKWIHAK